MTMVGLGGMVLGTVLIIVLYGIIPLVGYNKRLITSYSFVSFF